MKSLTEYGQKYKTLDREGVFEKSSIDFLKRLATTLNANSSHSRTESAHKIARQEIEGFDHLLKTYIRSVKDADLDEEQIFDSLTLLSWYVDKFWKSLV